MLEGKKILFISPQFFGYEQAICAALQKHNAEVDYFDERPSNSFLTKGIIRVNPQFYQRTIKKYYQEIENKTVSKTYDFLLLIKGETIPLDFLKRFKIKHPSTQMIFYSYDTVKEYPKFLQLFPLFDRSLTFEPLDALQYHLEFRPLFAMDTYQPLQENKNSQYDLCFVGSAHTDRYRVGEAVRKQLDEVSLTSFFYYFVPNQLVYFLKRLFDKNFREFDIKKLSFKSLSHQEILNIYQQSTAVLDINKPFQYGLSMRIFEILMSGRKLITTNPQIQFYPFYNEENTLYIDRTQPFLKRDFFSQPFNPLTKEQISLISTESWILQVFLNKNFPEWQEVLEKISKFSKKKED